MKKINYIKFSLDLIMALIFTLLFNKRIFGMSFHEIAGLVIGAIFLVHCGLNWKWIKGITLKFFNGKIPMKTRIGYILDIILLISIAVIIISGAFISKVVFVNLGLIHIQSFKVIHIFASYLSLMLIGIHLGLHWNWVMITFKKIFKIPQKKIFYYISKVMVVLVLAFGIYSFNSVGYISKLSINSAPKMENRDKGQFKQSEGVDSNNVKEGKTSKDLQNGSNSNNKGDNYLENYPKNAGNKNGETNISSILNAITLHLGVISVFSIVVYYLDKSINIRKKVS